MAGPTIQLQEPESFASGDTLWFERYLADYLPSAGWSLKYTLTALNGQPAAAVQSVVSDSNANRHKVYEQDFAAVLDAGDYIFTGELVNANTGDRKQIYKAVLTVGPDLQDGVSTEPLLSENAQALQDAYATRRALIKKQFSETEDLRSRFILQKLSEIGDLIKELEEKVIWEKRAARAANGQPDGSTPEAVLRIFA
jgi:hypothetical protein